MTKHSKEIGGNMIDWIDIEHYDFDLDYQHILVKTDEDKVYCGYFGGGVIMEKWYVFDYGDNDFRAFKDNINWGFPCVFEGSKEECEKWIKEHKEKTWFEDYLKLFPKESQKETCRIVTREVCKKILKETKKMWQEDSDYFSDLEGIIKDLGVEV